VSGIELATIVTIVLGYFGGMVALANIQGARISDLSARISDLAGEIRDQNIAIREMSKELGGLSARVEHLERA
jgi:hypothetical protein